MDLDPDPGPRKKIEMDPDPDLDPERVLEVDPDPAKCSGSAACVILYNTTIKH